MDVRVSEKAAADLTSGDCFMWCDRPVLVDGIEIKQRRWSVHNKWDNDLGLYLTCHEVDGTVHRLHYYSDELVRLFRG